MPILWCIIAQVPIKLYQSPSNSISMDVHRHGITSQSTTVTLQSTNNPKHAYYIQCCTQMYSNILSKQRYIMVYTRYIQVQLHNIPWTSTIQWTPTIYCELPSYTVNSNHIQWTDSILTYAPCVWWYSWYVMVHIGILPWQYIAVYNSMSVYCKIKKYAWSWELNQVPLAY